jgi:small subunit ribosomal protein S20
MPTHKSAWKRMRQNERKRVVNKAHRTTLRKNLKSFRELGDAETAAANYPAMASSLDKAAKKGIIHHRKADRLKSRLSRKRASA